jgi:hypothetical protein
MFGMTTRSRAREQRQSTRSKSATNKIAGNGERLPSEGCRKRKRTKPNGIGRRRVLPERKAKKRNRGEDEHDDGSCSSAVSSPLREPCMPDGTEVSKPVDSEIFDRYRDMQEEYYRKIGLRFDLRHPFQVSLLVICHLTNRREY